MAAFVVDRPARGQRFTTSPPGRRTTAGVWATGDASIGYSTMVFNTAQCWYLDNTFCAPLHAMPKWGDALIRVGLGFSWAIGVLMLARWLLSAVWRVRSEIRAASLGDEGGGSSGGGGGSGAFSSRRRRGRRRRWLLLLGGGGGPLSRACGCVRAALVGIFDAIESTSFLKASLALLLLATPPILYVRIYLPCVECFDFEAAAAHEIGHILGFHHPNVAENPNYNATAGAMGPGICTRPLDELETRRSTSGEGDDSIMFSTVR